jgi:outer membrane protein assembly factor BamA
MSPKPVCKNTPRNGANDDGLASCRIRNAVRTSALCHAGVLAVSAALVVGGPAMAAVPSSRAETLRQARAEKAQALTTYQAGWIEKAASFAGEKESGGKPLGWYPYFGSIFTGGAVAVGVGYRIPYADTGQVAFETAISPRLYYKFDLKADTPWFANRTMRVRGRALYLDAPKTNFYGIGNDSNQDDETSFRIRPFEIGATYFWEPRRWLSLGAGGSYVFNETDSGTRDPSIEDVFSPAEVPGMLADPNYIIARTFVEVDTRRNRGYAQVGTRVRADLSAFSDQDDSGYSFRRLDLEAGQLIPIARGNWVLALRGGFSFTDTSEGQVVPFFALPWLGGSRDLRGYQNFRFRDRHRMVLTGELRWSPSRLLDVALFTDAGKVAAATGDLDFDDLHTNYGIGARLHTSTNTLLRLELARSTEGFRFIFGVGPSF